jgi:hypothetical protein
MTSYLKVYNYINYCFRYDLLCLNSIWKEGLRGMTPWRNGSASDSRSEGCVFESRRGQQ